MVKLDDYQSCLVSHLEAYMSLSPNELALLAELERDEVEFDTRGCVQVRNSDAKHLFVVKRGWLFSSIESFDGYRHILQIHHPGDVIGIQNAPFEEATCDISTLDECVLCPFERQALGRIMNEQPRLGALLIAISARDQIVAHDLKRATTRYDAPGRVLLLLLVLLHRLRVTNPSMDDTMRLPLNQYDIGDTLGLTNVTVSKALRALAEDGWIAREASTITLRRIEVAKKRLEFENRYAEIDTSWFPESRGR